MKKIILLFCKKVYRTLFLIILGFDKLCVFVSKIFKFAGKGFKVIFLPKKKSKRKHKTVNKKKISAVKSKPVRKIKKRNPKKNSLISIFLSKIEDRRTEKKAKREKAQKQKELALEEKNRIKEEKRYKHNEILNEKIIRRDQRRMRRRAERERRNIARIERKNTLSYRQKQNAKLEKIRRETERKMKKQRREEEALKRNISKNEKKNKNDYKNEKIVLKKESFSKKIIRILKKINDFPTTFSEFIKLKYRSSSFAKNKRNKLDMNRKALLIEFESKEAERSDFKIMYEYIVKDKNGKIIKGHADGYSKVEVHSYLLSEGYEVYSIRTNKWIQIIYGGRGTNHTRMKSKDLIFFLTQLSTYVKAGITLIDSLKILTRQFKKKSYRKIFKMVVYDLSMGESFSTALYNRGNAFPSLLITMVKTAEMTGELPEVLDEQADYYTETEKTTKQMITAMMYPSLVFVFAIGVLTFIMLFVIPKFVNIYASMEGVNIPGITQFIINASNFMKENIIYIAIGFVLLIIILRLLYKKNRIFRTMVQWLLMHVPVIKYIIIYKEITMFTKTFASLLSHNVYITDSMEILSKVTHNEIYKSLIFNTVTNLARGERLSSEFEGHWAFPIPAYEMIVTGERTGQLPEMMEKVAAYYQELHRNSVTRIKTFVEPILIIFLTVVVGVIVLSIVLPMFNMYQSIQQI